MDRKSDHGRKEEKEEQDCFLILGFEVLYFFLFTESHRSGLWCIGFRLANLPAPSEEAMQKAARSSVKFVVLLILLSTLMGMAFAAPPARAKWTMMVYISGDNNLEDYVVKDIELELAPTGSSANVQVIALADNYRAI
jgi:hypothetical protein